MLLTKITECDKCERHTQCFKEGRLFAWFVSEDICLSEDYDCKGTHANLKIDGICPKKLSEKEQKDG